MRTLLLGLTLCTTALALSGLAQTQGFVPVTQEILSNPSPDDWLMFSRTYDAQRFSPLKQITAQNVAQLRLSWARGLPSGYQETIPLVYKGVMYVITPAPSVQALDATNGDLIWEYKHPNMRPDGSAKAKSLSIYEDLVFWTAPDSLVLAIDVRTGTLRWQARAEERRHTGGSIVADGKVITNGACGARPGCYISAYDAKTGKEAWRFYSVAGPDDPGDATWAGVPVDKRQASVWGLPGSYDPDRRMIYWGVANPTPYPRYERHMGNGNAIPTHAPADLYSGSTIALNASTGKLAWYYQHVPGDDWDQDANEERVLVRTAVNPDPKYVKWINPKVKKGDVRDVMIVVPEGGGLWELDRRTGEFLWATPFPYDTRLFYISKIDVETGVTHLNEELIFKGPGDRKTVCFWDTTSFWAKAYYPEKNTVYIPFIDNCVDMTTSIPAANGKPAVPQKRVSSPAADRNVDPKMVQGLAKVNVSTGAIERWPVPMPSNGAVLATAGNLIFWGDLNRRFRAFHADSGKVLWEAIIGGPVMSSTITYAVNGKQYLAVMSGSSGVDELVYTGYMAPVKHTEITPPFKQNGIYVFALP